MNVGDILRNKRARLIAVRVNETVRVAVSLLHKEGVGAVVVKDVCRTEGNTIVGMFSERDLVSALAEQGPSVLEKEIAHFATRRELYTCAPSDALEKALGLMLKHHVRHLPVLEGFTLIGVISMCDIVTRVTAHDVLESAPAIG